MATTTVPSPEMFMNQKYCNIIAVYIHLSEFPLKPSIVSENTEIYTQESMNTEHRVNSHENTKTTNDPTNYSTGTTSYKQVLSV